MVNKKIQKTENKIPLSVIVKNLGANIANAWSNIINGFKDLIEKEIKEINNKKWNPQTLEELGTMIEKKKYLRLANIKFSGPQDLLQNYNERINNLGNLEPPQQLREMAAIMNETNNQISFKPVLSINQNLMNNLKKYREEFVKNVKKLLQNAANGKITTFEINIDDQETAALFKRALEKISYQPEDQERFENLRIPAGKYPLDIKIENTKIIISWPERISVGTAKEEFGLKLSDVVPKKV